MIKWGIPIVLLIAAVVVVVFLGPWGGKGSAVPTIKDIDFPEQIQADGEKFSGTVHFHDPDGDIVRAKFDVVKAKLFDSFEKELEVQGQKEGSFQFYLFTVYPQKIVPRVTLIDSQDHVSEPMEFSFEAVLPEF